jgi:acyl-CoA synthetase (AMP-forming)/AMP-acid ligase II
MQSFAQTYDRTLRLASALEDLGAHPGSRVAILASNGPWYFELHFAASEAGLVEVPINGRFTLAEQITYLTALAPEFLLATAENVARGKDLQLRVPSIRHVIGIGEGHGLPMDYDRLLARAQPTERSLRDVDELVLISATSGTSGEAKAVQHTQRSTASAYAPLIERFEIGQDAHFVTGLAMYFATAYAGWTASFIAGAQHTIMPTYSPAGWVDLVEHTGATHGFLGPTPVYMLMDSGIDMGRLRGMRYLSMGGARCDPSRLSALTDALGSRVAIQLSMTELGAGTVLLSNEFLCANGNPTVRHRSVGRPIHGLDARTVDDNGGPTSAGVPGELEFRGPMVSPGYFGNPAADAAAHHDGWFRTGDLATIDEDGFIFVVDRKKDLIVSGGINIAPAEIEQVLMAHPAVAVAGVCGVSDAVYGEAVHAAVKLHDGAGTTAEDLMAWCREHLASVKKPRSIALVDDLPINSTGKLLRRELRAQFDSA